MRGAIAALMLCLFAGVAQAAAVEPSAFALYSNVCFHQEAGDLMGVRIGVLRLGDANYAFLQWAEGVLTEPHVVTLQPGELRNDRLTFSTSIANKPVTFKGRVTDKLLSGTLSYGTAERVNLPRVLSPSKKGVADCR